MILYSVKYNRLFNELLFYLCYAIKLELICYLFIYRLIHPFIQQTCVSAKASMYRFLLGEWRGRWKSHVMEFLL
jgi:hypothetical protein